jgi:hypothetical protein
MKLKLALMVMLAYGSSYAGTPAMDDTNKLYLIAMLLFALLIGGPYVFRFIKTKLTKPVMPKNQQPEDTGNTPKQDGE